MATETFKVLAQSAPGAATLTDAYTVPALTAVTVSTIVVTNRSTATSFRLSIAVAGAGDATKQYLAYDTPLGANETQTFTLGVTLGAADVVRVYNTLATVSFNVFGVEIT